MHTAFSAAQTVVFLPLFDTFEENSAVREYDLSAILFAIVRANSMRYGPFFWNLGLLFIPAAPLPLTLS
jgi:hypothetical protein